MAPPNLHWHDQRPSLADFRREVLQGLARRPRTIPPKFFYDAQGSRLFDAICELPEYYLTRTEIAILHAYGDEIARAIGQGCALIELGSGSSEKVRLLLSGVRPAIYAPLDISREHLLQSAKVLARDYPAVEIHAVCTDYTQDLGLPWSVPRLRRIAFFPGSSIGNFDPDEAAGLLGRIADLVRPDGGLLIGTDLKKEPAILDAAYDDAQGITAQFNLNLLARINRELGADFDLDGFAHRAFYDEARGRVEMHLESRRHQVASIDGHRFRFEPGDRIHTENSYKYGIDEFQSLGRHAGFASARVWIDPQRLFAVHYFAL